MLYPKLIDCVECSSIPTLLGDIDCKITDLAKNEYNNIIFALNWPSNGILIDDLLNYKRILTYRYNNPNYAPGFSIEQIASRIKVLINK
jgi:hypothetical protein